MERIEWGVLSPEDVEKLSVCVITEDTMKLEPEISAAGTLSDLRMGPRVAGEICGTCFFDEKSCVGSHFGRIELPEPCFFRHFQNELKRVLKRVCFVCKIRPCGDDFCGPCKGPKSIKFEEDGQLFLNDEPFTAEKTRDFLLNVPESTWKTLDVRSHPANMIQTRILVLPTSCRPYRRSSNGKWQPHAWTTLYGKLIKSCDSFKRATTKSELSRRRQALYFDLNAVVDSSTQRSNSSSNKKANVDAILSSVPRKEGIVRSQMLGKSVDSCARSVICGDDTLKIDEIGLPRSIADELKYPETVTAHNLRRLSEDVRKKNRVSSVTDHKGTKIDLSFRKDATSISKRIRPGWIVDRSLRNGDYVAFNRQPTLHAGGFMGFRVQIRTGHVIAMNSAVVEPFNADFDGDEMNVHAPRCEQARAELAGPMNVKNHVVGANGRTQIGLIQNSLVAAYRLSKRNRFFGKSEAFLLCGSPDRVPRPAVILPRKHTYEEHTYYWTGKQMLSSCLPFDLFWTDEGDPVEDDRTVLVRCGEILAGRLTKSHFGASGGKLIRKMWMSDRDVAAETIHRLQTICAEWQRDFSVGLEDFSFGFPKTELVAEDDKSYAADLDRTVIENVLDSLEFNRIRDMARSGSKGSVTNCQNVMHCVGVQSLNGRSVPLYLGNRVVASLRSDSPKNSGFVDGNYMFGLSPAEVAITQVVGRSTLISKTIKTSDIGYLTRRLGHRMFDCVVWQDCSVRDSDGRIVQFLYGEDGMDPKMVGGKHVSSKDFGLDSSDTASSSLFPPDPLDSAKIDDFLRKHVAARRLAKELKSALIGKRNLSWELDRLSVRLHRYRIEAGSPVGCVAAQAVSAPATQATLNSFHFSGDKTRDASTRSTPRLTELLHARSDISDRRFRITVANAEDFALRCKRDEILSCELRDPIGENESVPEWMSNFERAFDFEFPRDRKYLRIELKRNGDSLDYVRRVAPRPAVVTNDRYDDPPDIMYVVPFDDDDVPRVLGSQSFVEEVKVISSNELLVRCSPEIRFRSLLTRFPKSVDHRKTRWNDVVDVAETLGIEAARTVLFDEFKSIESFSVGIDDRHVMLLCDVMTYRGAVSAIDWKGLQSTTSSSLTRMCFERPIDNVVRAAVSSEIDYLASVSANVLSGNLFRSGTGFPWTKLLVDVDALLKYARADYVPEERASRWGRAPDSFAVPTSEFSFPALDSLPEYEPGNVSVINRDREEVVYRPADDGYFAYEDDDDDDDDD